jgi:hypothetical protein
VAAASLYAPNAHAMRGVQRAAVGHGDAKAPRTIGMCPFQGTASSPGQPAATGAAEDDELPWCVSADDPRCSPLRHDAPPLPIATRPIPGAAAEAITPPPPVIAAQRFTAHSGLAPRPGVASRVERPPRTGSAL